jgi:hypothetical protein
MPEYEIEQYELHTSKYRVTAANEAEAIWKLFDGEGEFIDNSMDFIEVADDRGMPIDQHAELVAALRKLDMCQTGDVIPSIRSVEKL